MDLPCGSLNSVLSNAAVIDMGKYALHACMEHFYVVTGAIQGSGQLSI